MGSKKLYYKINTNGIICGIFLAVMLSCVSDNTTCLKFELNGLAVMEIIIIMISFHFTRFYISNSHNIYPNIMKFANALCKLATMGKRVGI